jgi:diguanylate cyclase (GGDEF)-like protein
MINQLDDILDTAPCGFLSLTDDGTIVLINSTLLELLEYSLEQTIGKKIGFLLPVASQIFYQTHFLPLLKLNGKANEIYFSFKSRSRVNIPMLVNAVRKNRNEQIYNDCILIPIHQRIKYEDEILKAKKMADAAILSQKQAEISFKKSNELLKKLVNTDGLTQIPNRRYFDHYLAQEWSRLRQDKRPLSLILFDVDYFKKYNDIYGHQQGDDCLIQIAQGVQKSIYRPDDLLARYGGEEFAVILPDTNSQGAIIIAERIHQAIQSLNIPHLDSNVSDKITISLGIATLIPSIETQPSLLIRQADQALYLAKQEGRNQSICFVDRFSR